jgi:hypothetical protein
VIGCLGALRLNERLLNAYWIILLVLLVGDVLVGGFWLARYTKISANLGRDLRTKFENDYRKDGSEFRDGIHLQCTFSVLFLTC